MESSMGGVLTSRERLALSLVFASKGERQFNRKPGEYTRIAAELPCLKKLHYEVNELLKERCKSVGPMDEICRFRAGDDIVRYDPFPTSISTQTLRTALVKA